jgi:acyl-CoA thioester hydrolase
MPESVITYRGTVYPWHCDHMGHMNVMWYVGKFDEATWQLFNHLGLAPSRLSQEGAGMAAVEQHIEYRRELRAGYVITVRSTVLEVKDKSIRFAHEMTNDENGEVAARTTLTGVYIDTSLRKARPLPPEIKERLRLMVAITPHT